VHESAPISGTILRAGGKDCPQLIGSSGARWTDAAEALFLDHLAASCNVTAAAGATGVSELMKERAEMSVRVL